MSTRAKLGLILGVIAVIAVAYSLMVLEVQGSHDDACKSVTAIASDPRKMNYVRSWVASRTSEQEFMEAVKESGSFARGDPRSRKYIDLDWRYLGFAPQLAWVEFNINNGGRRDVSAAEIASISLHQGRSSIIVKLNAASDLGLQWPPEAMKNVRSLVDDVFVYCEYSH